METTNVNSASTALEIKHCQGHEVHLGTLTKREDVRKVSDKELTAHAQDPNVISYSTHMVESIKKRKVLGTKKVYDLYVTFKHKDNVLGCDHFTTEKILTMSSNPIKAEGDDLGERIKEVFYDAKEAL